MPRPSNSERAGRAALATIALIADPQVAYWQTGVLLAISGTGWRCQYRPRRARC